MEHKRQFPIPIYTVYWLGLHTGALVPIDTKIRFEKDQYLTVYLRTAAKRAFICFGELCQ